MKRGTKTIKALIIRPSSIGDIVMASPVLKAMTEAQECYEIHWLIYPGFSCLLRHNPYVNRLILWDKDKWKSLIKNMRIISLFREILYLKRLLRAQNYDICLDMQGLFRSRFLAFLSGAKRRIGFASKEPGSFFMTKLIPKGAQSHVISSEYIFMMEYLGINVNDPLPFIVIPPDVMNKAKAILQKVLGENAGAKTYAPPSTPLEQPHGKLSAYPSDMDKLPPFASICPFTTRPQKHWFSDEWLRLCELLWKELGFVSIIMGGPKDREKAEMMAHGREGYIVPMAGQSTLMMSASILSFSDVIIGVDTGLTHMGTALKRPTVALFGATRPYLNANCRTTRVLYSGRKCSPCRRSPTCDNKFDCMKDISVEQTMDAVKKVIYS